MAFESFMRTSHERRPGRGLRLGGQMVAVALHLGAIAALAAVTARPPAPRVSAPPAVEVRVAKLDWASLRRIPNERKVASSPKPADADREVNAEVVAKPEVRSARRPRPALARRTAVEAAASPAAAAVAEPAESAASEPARAEPVAVAGTGAAAGGEASGPPAASRPAAVAPRSANPRFVPEPLAAQQKLAGAAPEFPAVLARDGAHYVAHARICVAPTGAVDRVEILKSAHPVLDANVVRAVGRWRYRPLVAGGTPIPFCTLARFEFRAT